MPDNSVVNLLDLRDDEDQKASGGRWARRNPKASAKGGRARRQRKRPGDEDGMQRKGSTASNASNTSDVSDVGSEVDEEQPAEARTSQAGQAPPPRASQPPAQSAAPAPPAEPPVAHRTSNPLLARLSNKQEEGKAQLLAAVEPDTTNIDVADMAMVGSTRSDDGENVFEEAKKVARQREVLKNDDHGLQGKDFERRFWEYYMVKERFSDGLCVALNHLHLVPWCIVPCLWPPRLFATIQRAAPIKIKMCFCSCPIGGCCGVPLVTIIFVLPILAAVTFIPDIKKLMQEQFKNIPALKDQNQEDVARYMSLGLTGLALFLMVFWWARILLGVAQKYQIKQAMDKPNSFVSQAICCICCMSIRVAVHVDRAQGFMLPVKADKTTVELSDQIRLVNPAQNLMV